MNAEAITIAALCLVAIVAVVIIAIANRRLNKEHEQMLGSMREVYQWQLRHRQALQDIQSKLERMK